MRRLHSIVAAGDPKFILERRFRDYYGPPKLKTETELTGPGGAPIAMREPHRITFSCTDNEGLKNLIEEVKNLPILDSQTMQPIRHKELTPHGTAATVTAHLAVSSSWFIVLFRHLETITQSKIVPHSMSKRLPLIWNADPHTIAKIAIFKSYLHA
jgi:hypothetical protein